MNKLIPSLKDFFNILLTFSMTVFAWIFFRAENLHYAFNYISGIFNWSLFAVPKVKPTAYATLVLIGFFMTLEWIGREHQFAIQNILLKKPRFIRWLFYAFIILLIGLFLQPHETPFIYFQF